MSGITLRVDSSPVDGLLSRLAASGRDLTPAMGRIGELLVESSKQNFDEQRGPDGTPWKPSWRVQKEGGETLRLTGRMFGSINAVPGSRSVEVGTPVEYAPPNQLGATIRAKNAKALAIPFAGGVLFRKSVEIPARPFLGIRADDWPEIESILTGHMTGGGNG